MHVCPQVSAELIVANRLFATAGKGGEPSFNPHSTLIQPAGKGGEPDNRVASFHVALYWAQAMARRAPSSEFGALAAALGAGRGAIVQDMLDCQGAPVDIGGYYRPDPAKVERAMRPSVRFNALIDAPPSAPAARL